MVSNQSKTTGDSNSQDTSKSAKNKELTTSKSKCNTTQNEPAKVPSDDSTGTANVQKNNNKLSNKPARDTDLALIIKTWPELPEAIRTAIVAIVRASNDNNKE